MSNTPPRPAVSLVIPVRNGARTIEACLKSVVGHLGDGSVSEILVVDDRSTDNTAEIVRSFDDVRLIDGPGEGAAVARNLGAEHATGDVLWFLDADCVAEPDALEQLLPHLDNPHVAGVGGTYTNGCPDSRLATLIHDEIVARHAVMPTSVNHLATYDVLYRRDVFEQLGGFDPGSFWAHDVEFAYRVIKAGHVLHFEPDSRVAHFHPTRLWGYLKKQMKQGYYRMRLYRLHPGGVGGDSYTAWFDIAQPLLAAVYVLLLPLWPVIGLSRGWLPASLANVALVIASIVATSRVYNLRSLFHWKTFNPGAFFLLTYIRSFFRTAGMLAGAFRFLNVSPAQNLRIGERS